MSNPSSRGTNLCTKMTQNIEFKESGIQCDNPECNYTNSEVTYEIQHEWIDKPCPKCGHNLLTQEDHDRFMMVMEGIKYINSLSQDEINIILGSPLNEEEMENLKEDRVNIKIHTHKEIKIELDDQDD